MSKQLRRVVVVVLVGALASCSKQDGGAAAGGGGGSACGPAVESAIQASLPQLQKVGMGGAATVAKIKDASLARCQEDLWSPEAIACLAGSKTEIEVRECQRKLTPEQRGKFDRAIGTIAAAAPVPAPQPADPGSAGSGSAP